LLNFEHMTKLLLTTLAMAWAILVNGAPNELTPQEKAEGWKLLFDGKTTVNWRGFKEEAFPDKGWIVEEGVLKKVGGVRGGDIITKDTFDDFDFRWEWRIGPRANNGIKYFITEEREGGAIGHEYQMVDDALEKMDKNKTASFYQVLPPRGDKPLKPLGEWNSSRVVVKGTHVEHWLNGAKVLEYELGSEEVKAAVANSKFKSVKGFGDKLKGHILLTDHVSEAWFRNIRIRELY
jgi:hypothetical protein